MKSLNFVNLTKNVNAKHSEGGLQLIMEAWPFQIRLCLTIAKFNHCYVIRTFILYYSTSFLFVSNASKVTIIIIM